MDLRGKRFMNYDGRIGIANYLMNLDGSLRPKFVCHYEDSRSDDTFIEYQDYIERNLIKGELI